MNSLYYRDPATQLHIGDACSILAAMPADSADCVVTSPPQWGLRDYGTATWTGGNAHCRHTLGTTPHQRRTATLDRCGQGSTKPLKRCRKCGAECRDLQYGLEPAIEDYVERLRLVGIEIARVLRPRGTFWLNLRDSYSYHANGTGRANRNPADESSRANWAVRHKSLFGLPWRVVFALQAEGWVVRNAIVWHKPNGIPDPARDRLSQRYEMLFLLVKQPDYHFEVEPVLEPYSHDRPAHRKTHYGGTKPNSVKTPWRVPTGQGRNPGDVWSIPTRPLREAHCAAFPVDIPLRCIAAGCPPNGTVLDPFSGAGTTGLAAHQLKRDYAGIDLRAQYHEIFLRRRRSVSAKAG
ncbi:DNA-methyltransferase [Saccharopolyspora elongata]|uniref:Methyltransferase n=1 Tax=Saccharopolyspora elongata TaxID=2530387 RepID=A0A4R4YGP2_9PSEU|nr:site-specific DNA-methyltransferase [Saccharopolyspora elongata]TDD43069.1 site-specific DNA-methyltransferase [Saccharopolyspora elongata]